MKIKKILISQPRPELERSPYFEIAKTHGVEIDFRPFVQVEGIPAREFRKNRVDILSYTAIIMTSKNAVDHFFRICTEMRIIVPETMKYFCISETTAYYLQKYIQFRKRKIFFSNHSYADLVDLIRKKHKDDKYLLPCSDAPNEEYTSLLDRDGIRYAKAPLYRAVNSDIKDINFSEYDMVVLFSSAGLNSLFNSFPDYKQNETVIAAFGEQTARAVTTSGLKFHILAPQPNTPSMASAMDLYLRGEYVLSDDPFAHMGPQKKQKTPAVKKPKPPVAKPEIAAKKEVPAKKEVKPVAKAPVAAPAKTVQKPLIKKANPVVKKKPVAKPAPKPVAKKSKPAPKKSKPVPQKKKPVASKKPAPAKKKPAPKKAKKAGKGRK
ncbi:MAG TPA: uroporphyrinogen-III synthase [Bacteroidia bacterium]|nr:uroporphyrinogen-III synthase [Bacteroidia bacterium]